MKNSINELICLCIKSCGMIQMKKLLIICFLIIGIVLISGCTSEEKTNSETSIDSQNSDIQNPELIIKQSDVPGLTLSSYKFYAVPKSTPDIGVDYFHDFYGTDEVNEITWRSYLTLPFYILEESEEYDDVLPIGTRNVGQSSDWRGESRRRVNVALLKFDSSKPFHNYYAEAWDVFIDYAYQNPSQEYLGYNWSSINKKVDLSIGDYCYYISKQNKYNADVQETRLVMLYEDNFVIIVVSGETGDSENENDAIRIAKKIKSRLD